MKDSTVGEALGALFATRGRSALVLVTAMAGAIAAFFLAFGFPAESRTFVAVVPLTQLVISVLTPFATAALTHDLRDQNLVGSLPSRWIASALYGLAFGVYGAAVAAVAVSAANGSTPAIDPWNGAATAFLGCLVVQLIPVGVGAGAGLLLGRLSRARLLTVVVPLGLSFVLARLAPAGTTDWITPLGAADHLLPGPMSLLAWVQWVVTAALWVVLPNAVGARLLRRRASAAR